jgi:hypothetical protein
MNEAFIFALPLELEQQIQYERSNKVQNFKYLCAFSILMLNQKGKRNALYWDFILVTFSFPNKII